MPPDQPAILIVEDEPAIADTIQYALETDGFQTIRVAEGRGVPDLLMAKPIDLIVLDIGLPDVNGLELCKKIRKNHSVPIIFLTARSEEIDRVVGLEIGADDYVVKPFSPRELTARIKAVLRRVRLTPHQQVAPDRALQIDTVKHQVRYFNILLELSKTEFDLLQVLAGHPGQVFSREQLMLRAWTDPEASMDRTVDAHVKNLRAKLRRIQPQIEAIITHRGVGYSFKEGL